MIALQEQLRSEARTCPQCRFVVENPFSERCPRCLTYVPVIDPGCSKCIHNSGCPVSSAAPTRQNAHRAGKMNER